MGAPEDIWLLGATVSHEFRVIDTGNNPVNFLLNADFSSMEVYYRTASTNYAVDSGATLPVITWKGQAGIYELTWTVPSGYENRVVALVWADGGFVDSAFTKHIYSFQTQPVTLLGSADSWSSVNEVIAILGWPALSTSTIPTTSQVETFLARTAAPITAMLRRAGLNYTTPNGGTPLTSGTDVEIMLNALCARANGLAAAGHAAMAAEMRDQPGVPERAKGLFELAREARVELENYLKTLPVSNYGSMITSTVDSTTEAIDNKPFTMDTEW